MKNTISLRKNNQFRYVYNRGKSIANRHLVMYLMPNDKGFNQLGLSVSKKVGNSVVRSKVTRLIREAYRLKEDKIKTGFDIIFIARASCAEAGFKDIAPSVMHLIKKHNMLKIEKES